MQGHTHPMESRQTNTHRVRVSAAHIAASNDLTSTNPSRYQSEIFSRLRSFTQSLAAVVLPKIEAVADTCDPLSVNLSMTTRMPTSYRSLRTALTVMSFRRPILTSRAVLYCSDTCNISLEFETSSLKICWAQPRLARRVRR
jgi:hypothetical protein